MMNKNPETIKTKIWKEEPESDNPFAAKTCYCHGYDVFGDLLGKASWVEYLFLLFKGERPTPKQSQLLEGLAIIIANPGIRDHSIRAAMNGGVGGSQHAACLMAALAVGAGQYSGAHEVAIAIQYWDSCRCDLNAWKNIFKNPPYNEAVDVWTPIEHPPGFDPHGVSCTSPVRSSLNYLASLDSGTALQWLKENRGALELEAKSPLAMTGVAAAALYALEMSPDQGEMLYLLLRLPGAAVHALEQREYGWRNYPFFANEVSLTNDPLLNNDEI